MRKPRTREEGQEAFDIDLMMEAFQTLDDEALTMSPKELSEADPTWTRDQWKQFILHPKTKQYIRNEMDIIRENSVNKLLKDSGESNSVGKAQLMNSLISYDQKTGHKKDGPVFIYCHIPLTEDEVNSPVVGRVNGRKK